VGLHPVVHDAAAQAPGDDADGAEDRDRHEERDHPHQQGGADLAVVEGGDEDVLGGPAEHPGVGDGEHAEQHGAEGGHGEDARLTLDADPQDAEAVECRGAPQLRILAHRCRPPP
jgi:hypothetical protein